MMRLLFTAVVVIVAMIARIGLRSGDLLSPQTVHQLADSVQPPARLDDELPQIIDLQTQATPQDQRRIFDESFITVFSFAEQVGGEFTAAEQPEIARLFEAIDCETDKVIDAAQIRFPREAMVMCHAPSLQVATEYRGKFPARDIVRAQVFAQMLAELFPEKRETLLSRSAQIAHDSVVGGSQLLSDVDPSITLGDAIAKQLVPQIHLPPITLQNEARGR